MMKPMTRRMMRVNTFAVLLLATPMLTTMRGCQCQAFLASSSHHNYYAAMQSQHIIVMAKPQRLEENVEGVVHVNDRCINCAACSNFAPETFRRSTRDNAHIVYQQPSTASEIDHARAALAACPVAAIRVETKAERRHRAAVLAIKNSAATAVTATAGGDQQLAENINRINASKDAAVAEVEGAWTQEDETLVQKMSIKLPKQATDDNHNNAPFPRKFLNDISHVHYVGYHNERSFGATPYLVQTHHYGQKLWVMVDTPRFSPLSIKAVESLTGSSSGPDYLFLTHVDDTADHGKWAAQYPSMRRILHASELEHNWVGDETLENVEVLLPKINNAKKTTNGGLTMYALNGTVLATNAQPDDATTFVDEGMVVLHTPGHSPGSISLYKYPSSEDKEQDSDDNAAILFTGDTYAYTTRDGGRMTAFPRYGNDLWRQSLTLQQLVQWSWNVIAPGHGHPRDYRDATTSDELAQVKLEELAPAQLELQRHR